MDVPDKEIVEAVIDALGLGRRGREDAQKDRHHDDDECAAPGIVVYLILCDCVTINNGACEDWKFCNCRKHDGPVD